MRRSLCTLVPLLLVLLLPRPASGQERAPAALEPFIHHLARLWAEGEAAAIVAFAPADGRILLDLGEEAVAVQPRHAAAALRGLFSEEEGVATRASRIAVAGGQPVRGFGELAWTTRARGASEPRSRVVYVGAVWQEGRWRIREIRMMP